MAKKADNKYDPTHTSDQEAYINRGGNSFPSQQ